MFTLVLLILAACGEDEPKVDPVKVQFNAGNPATITEDGGAKVITLSLSSAAKKNGTITLSAAPANANTFATFPATITVTKGSTSAQFTVTPINNAIIDAAAKIITFTLEDPTSGFELGTTTTHILTITDDEGPTTANFNVTTGTVSENSATGIDVVIGLSTAAEVAGSIEVTMTPAEAAVTTTPAATAGKITVPVTVGQTSVSFKVVPVNNEDDGEDLEIAFEITGSTGGVNVGTNVDYTLTVTDDDDIVPTDISVVRALYTASDVTINTETYIEGVVISNGNNVTNRNVFVQDETGVIVVRFTAAHSFVQGDKLLIDLNGALLTRDAGAPNTGPLQLGGTPGIALTKATKTGTGTVPAAETVTIAQLNAGTFEGKLVKLENVFFPDADGTIKLNGSRTLSNGTATTVVRSESYSPWQNNAIPLGSGTIEGIASIFNGAAQILPLETADIFANNPVGTIGTTGTLADFGTVNNGAASTEQSYTVQGTTLTNDIVVTASAGYQVSLTSGGTFGSTVTIPAANANSATTVFVKFMPATGVNQAVAGTLTHKSQGAASVVVNVTGTEAGNVTSSLLLSETFDYAAAQGTDMIVAAGGPWVVSAANATKVTFSTTPLIMTDYPGSNVGGAAAIAGNGEDIKRLFTEKTSGVIYSSAIVNVASATSTGDYFYHFVGSGGTPLFSARVFAKDNGSGGLQLGIQKTSGTGAGTVYSTTTYAYNTNYVLVIKFDFTTQVSSLYVMNAVALTEPATADAVESGSTTVIPNITAIGIRQSASTPTAKIDAIRVATVWADLFN